MTRLRLALILLLATLTSLAPGCAWESDSPTTAEDATVETAGPDTAPDGATAGDPCLGVDCSGFGTCYSSGADAVCVCDPGYTPAGLTCVPSATCGNGALDLGEFCDPAALDAVRPCWSVHPKYDSGTALCESDCTLDLSDCVTSSVCGNQLLEKGETCDDGNLVNGDGCSSTCANETATSPDDCGTEAEALVFDAMLGRSGVDCTDPEQATLNDPGEVEPVRVRVHITQEGGQRSDDNLDIDDIHELFADANALLAAANITAEWDGDTWDAEHADGEILFNIEGWPTTVALPFYASDSAEFELPKRDPAAFDLFIVNSIKIFKKQEGSDEPEIGEPSGFALIPKNLAVIRSDASPATLAHELGHLFSLKHTHHVPSEGEEERTAENCSLTNDRCCDTAFDAALYKECGKVQGGQCLDDCGNGQEPPIHNTMSYYSCGDLPHAENFTSCQAARARCYLSQHRANVLGSYTCEPSCPLSACGDDGCGGSCGECSHDGVCVDGLCECASGCLNESTMLLASCETTNCTPLGLVCEDDQCVPPPCEPDCTEKSCGDDGCGGSCGTCPDGGTCEDGACACETACKSASHILLEDCSTTNCGAFGLVCEDAACVPACEPSCDGKSCGDDGCGGSCGTCPDGGTCEDGACSCETTCTSASHLLLPDCSTTNCGSFGLLCEDATCVPACEPSCEDKQCGDDGCGGSCGTCPQNGTCEGGACSCEATCLSGTELLLTNCTVATCGVGLVCLDDACLPL